MIGVKWQLLPLGWHKLNIYGLALANLGRAGAGMTIQDHRRDWIAAAFKHIPDATSVQVQLWAPRDGLKLAKVKNIHNVVVELDAAVIIIWFLIRTWLIHCFILFSYMIARFSLMTSTTINYGWIWIGLYLQCDVFSLFFVAHYSVVTVSNLTITVCFYTNSK